MTPATSVLPRCPQCGNKHIKLREHSLNYSPEEWLGQTLKERELHTLAYECDCGMAFTHTVKGNWLPPEKLQLKRQ